MANVTLSCWHAAKFLPQYIPSPLGACMHALPSPQLKAQFLWCMHGFARTHCVVADRREDALGYEGRPDDAQHDGAGMHSMGPALEVWADAHVLTDGSAGAARKAPKRPAPSAPGHDGDPHLMHADPACAPRPYSRCDVLYGLPAMRCSAVTN